MIDITDPKNKDSIIPILRSGLTSEFWEIMCQVLDQNIEHIQSQLDDEDTADWNANEYKVQMEVWKGRKRDLTKLKNLPETLIVDLEDPDQSEPDLRAYEDLSDLAP